MHTRDIFGEASQDPLSGATGRAQVERNSSLMHVSLDLGSVARDT